MGGIKSHPILSTQRSCVRILCTACPQGMRGGSIYAPNSVAIWSLLSTYTCMGYVRIVRTSYVHIQYVRTHRRRQYLLSLCKLSPQGLSVVWTQDVHPSRLYVRRTSMLYVHACQMGVHYARTHIVRELHALCTSYEHRSSKKYPLLGVFSRRMSSAHQKNTPYAGKSGRFLGEIFIFSSIFEVRAQFLASFLGFSGYF